MRSKGIHPRRFWSFALVIALVMGLVGVLGATVSQATIGDDRVATWNMFGASSAQGNKWSLGVSWLARQADVVALQEAGSTPPGTVQEVLDANSGLLIAGNHDDEPVVLPPDVGSEVTHTLWEYNGQARHIYWLATDRSAENYGWTLSVGHVNLAIVSRFPADDVVIIPNTLADDGGNHPYSQRAALGIRIDNNWYFTLHGMSGNGNDDAGLLRNISEFIADRPLSMGQQHWIALGDYNREPGTFTLPAGTVLYSSGQPTHALAGQGSGNPNELDYAVGTPGFSDLLTQRLVTGPTQSLSDHVPVLVSRQTLPTQPAPLLSHAVSVQSMQSGAVLDAEHEGTASGTSIVSYVRTGQDNQSWDMEVYDNDGTARFVGVASGRCIDTGQNPGSLTQLTLQDCSSNSSQRWSMESVGTDQWQLHSELRPDLCMNIRGGQTNPWQAKDVILYACQNTPNERFTFTTADASTDQDPYGWVRQPNELYGEGPYSMENMTSGGFMDVYHERTANDSDVIAWQRTGGSNQGWWLRWRDGHTASFEGVGSHRCLDIYNSNDQVGPDRHLVVWNCTGQPSQGWIGVRLNNGQIQWHNQLYNNLCLDVADPSHGPTINNTGALVTQNCTIAWGSQQWSFGAFDLGGIPSLNLDQDWDGDNLRVGLVIPNPGPPAQRVGYFNSWSIYANNFTVKDLDTRGIAGKLTQLNYAFENIDPNTLTCFADNHSGSSDEGDPSGNDGASDAWADYQKGFTAEESVDGSADTWTQPLKGNFNQLKQLKQRYPNLKVVVSLGGWTYSKYFSDVAATAQSRHDFVSSCIDMYIRGNLPQLGEDPAGGQGVGAGVFDGFDIDWEFPASADGHTGNHYSPADTANYTALLQEFRSQLDALGSGHYRLTAALPAGPDEIDDIDSGSVGDVLDFGSVMSYDMHGAWEAEGPTNFQAPLYDSGQSPAFFSGMTVNDAINHYLINGFPANKLIMGVPFYGRGWTGVPDGGNQGLYQSVTGPTDAFPFSQAPGVAMYKELDTAGKLGDLKFDPQTLSSWVYDGSNFWSIESPQSLIYKRQYIQNKGLAGVMIYSLEADDPSSTLLNAATGS